MTLGARLQTPNYCEAAEVPQTKRGIGIEVVEIRLARRSARPQKPNDPTTELTTAFEDLQSYPVGEHPGAYGHFGQSGAAVPDAQQQHRAHRGKFQRLRLPPEYFT